MPLWSLSKDRITEMAEKIDQRKRQIAELESTTIEQLWMRELDKFADAYVKENGLQTREIEEANFLSSVFTAPEIKPSTEVKSERMPAK